MENNLFLGLKPYSQQEAQYLPARDKETRMLEYMLSKNQISVLCGAAKSGKTSLINAATRKEALDSEKAAAIFFDVPEFHFGDPVLETRLADSIREMCPGPTYLDIAMEDDKSLWMASKKLQATCSGCAKFYLIIDQFENMLTYGAAARSEFAAAIAMLIEGRTPPAHQEKIQSLIMGQNQPPLPREATPLLISSPRFHILISISKSQYGDLAQMLPAIKGIFQNTLEINPFDIETAKAAMPAIAAQPIEQLSEINIDPEAAEAIASSLAQSGGEVYPGKLRNAILFLRSAAKGGRIGMDGLQKSGLLQKSWTREALALVPDPQERQAIIDFALGEMAVPGETQPLPAYLGIASKRYGISGSAIELMEKYRVLRRQIGSDSRAYCLPFEAPVLKDLEAMSARGAGSRQKEGHQHRASAAADMAPKSRNNGRRAEKPLILMLASAVIVLLAFVFMAFSLKSDVEREARTAKSNMLAATSFQKLDSDPTMSLRLAQRAVKADSSNIHAYSALLNAYYNTDIFYNICGQIEGKVAKAEIAPDGQHIMAYISNDAAQKYAARILSTEGYVMLEVPHKCEVTSISLVSGKIITTSYDSIARVFDMHGKELARIDGHKAILWAADISPDQKHIVTAGSDCNLMLWDMSGKLEAVFRGHDFDVYSAKFSPDGKMVLSSSGDNTARLWSIDGKTLNVLQISEDSRFSQSIVSQAVFSPDCQYVLMAANDRLNINHKARLWDTSGKELATFGGHKEFINSVAFSPDGSQVITSSRDKIVRVFGLAGKLEKELKGHGSNVWSAQFLPGGQGIISVGDDRTIRSWTIGKRFESYPNAVNASCAAFSPSGINLLVVQDSTAQLWDLTGEVAATFKGHAAPIAKARFAQDGRSIITSAKDGSSIIWDTKGNIIKRLSLHADEVLDGVFSPDGTKAVTVSCDSTIIIRDLASGSETRAGGHGGCVTCVCFAPDGRTFATGGSDGRVVIHDAGGNEVRSFQGHDARVNSVSYSPSGKNIISTSSDETAVLWDNMGQILHTFRGYENKVNSAAFSPDGKFVLTTSDDGSARMWTTSGMEVMNFMHEGAVCDAVFSPDGRHIITIYRTDRGLKAIKLRMLKAEDISMRIDEKALSGTIWQPDSALLRKYGVD